MCARDIYLGLLDITAAMAILTGFFGRCPK